MLVHDVTARKYPYKVIVKVNGEKHQTAHVTEAGGRAALNADWVHRMAMLEDPYERLVLHLQRGRGQNPTQAERTARLIRSRREAAERQRKMRQLPTKVPKFPQRGSR